ncbi:hypothetical protein PGT21_025702 [Puccinia graminis f. sp. tritici]|uniref:Aminotransferase class I/classII large domain-containing protein n=1 Tax=Puccinia graminis f. sp. tritici TaxID=56615 RepID=A0A5B0Q6X3_PUCGR|nr:hypothetical protein PGT21_025702 [Puccinia graminis f. sp. tritici]
MAYQSLKRGQQRIMMTLLLKKYPTSSSLLCHWILTDTVLIQVDFIFYTGSAKILVVVVYGVLISQHNSDLLRLITDLNLNQVQVSSLTEFCFSNLILNNSDHPDHQEFLESYLIESKKRLLKAHQTVTEKLKELKIDYNNPSNGGFFLMIDLSRYLREPSDLNKDKQTAGVSRTAEEMLFQILLKEYKIYMAPGNVYNYPKPGFFRLTFTVPPDHLDLGLQRLARFMESYETLPPMSNLQISR